MLFYKCSKCGNFITFLTEKTPCTPICCGEPMEELVANTTDAATEKHVPVITVDGDKVTVQVGSTIHPMTPDHYIQFIVLETSRGYQKVDLEPGIQPVVDFKLNDDEEPVAAYEYCNLHGLWKATV
ncbi:MAG: desulfoferrodoxin family protein [Lachnospiraceae bacterium]|nr:desulfoferrodoxin family protein [Lachnospiraceae bacterium]